ncbi:MAG: hypothetical protein GY714_00050, partial [Desulfobacterales bacterium]|nr:hypothetical protein [Desulfobacterales bacterium]
QTLVRLLATAPVSDAKQIISGLGSSNSTLLERLEDKIHGDEYKQYHKILNSLYFQSMKPKEAAIKMEGAKELPWSDPGFIEGYWKARFYYHDIEITDKGKIRFKYYFTYIILQGEEQQVELDPLEMVAVRFYAGESETGAKESEVKFMPAINFMALIAKQFRNEVGIVADVLITMSGIGAIASAPSKGKKVMGALQVAFGLTDVVIREFRGKIAQFDEGKDFLKYWDMVTALVAIYSIGQLVGNLPGIFKNLRGKYAALRGKAIKNLDDAELKSFEDSIEIFLKKGDDAVEKAKGTGTKGGKTVEHSPQGANKKILEREASWFDEVAKNATVNSGSDKLVLGHFSQDAVSYQKVAAHYKSTYFKINDWNAVTKGLSQDEIWRINRTFLTQQLKQGKQILFSHNPFKPRPNSFFEREVNFLRDLGYNFRQKNQWTWEAIK